MMNTESMMTIGKRWQKNGMDRIYINFSLIADDLIDEVWVRNWFNRFERNNLKIFWDVNKEELILTHGSEEAKEIVRRAIENRLAKN